MMKHGLVGLDVLNIAVHLTAAMLASSYPDTPFEGECLLTMAYGKQPEGPARIGSLELLAESVQEEMIGQAAAVTAGGRSPEDVRDLVNRVQHAKFDLVIMNPPFIRSTGMEAEKRGVGNPAFAAFQTSGATQSQMQARLVRLRGGKPIATGNAGLAADFLELSLRKVRPDGTIALVLPLSAVSGMEWEKVREAIGSRCRDIVVVTIAGARAYDAAFSADTKMAECLLLARRGATRGEKRATFVMLRRRVRSALEGELVAAQIGRIRESGKLRRLEGGDGLTALTVGGEECGVVLDAPLPESGPWPLVGVLDEELAQVAWNLERGNLVRLGSPNVAHIALPVTRIAQIASRGPYHADIYWEQADGTPRGPFSLHKPARKPHPMYPMLWAHAAKRERQLVVMPDSEGEIKPEQDAKAATIWATATRTHYNRDLRFNSQALIVAMTERKCIGGEAWPSVIFKNPAHEYTFALWCNSTLGLLLHWWVTNKTQSGRGRTTVTGIPRIPSLDVRMLNEEQHAAARAAFDALRDRRFLPFDQIDEDEARAELDRRLLVDVLGLPESLCEPGGTMDLLRRKLAAEPQVHGGKQTRVVFHEETIDGQVEILERSEKRSDR